MVVNHETNTENDNNNDNNSEYINSLQEELANLKELLNVKDNEVSYQIII